MIFGHKPAVEPLSYFTFWCWYRITRAVALKYCEFEFDTCAIQVYLLHTFHTQKGNLNSFTEELRLKHLEKNLKGLTNTRINLEKEHRKRLQMCFIKHQKVKAQLASPACDRWMQSAQTWRLKSKKHPAEQMLDVTAVVVCMSEENREITGEYWFSTFVVLQYFTSYSIFVICTGDLKNTKERSQYFSWEKVISVFFLNKALRNSRNP